MKWFNKHAQAIEAIAALLTALVAVAALIGVKVQLEAADRLQQKQSARDAFRAHLVLATQYPQYARPESVKSLLASKEGGAYMAFVDHLLYSAEQMLVVNPQWEETFLYELAPHHAYLCAYGSPVGESEQISRLLKRFKAEQC